MAPHYIELEVWQKAMFSCIYGLVDAEGHRQFREVVLLVGRKNGKTKIASSLANYTFRLEGGFGSRVFCIAPKLDQADLVYNDIWMMTTLDPEWQELKEELLLRSSPIAIKMLKSRGHEFITYNEFVEKCKN